MPDEYKPEEANRNEILREIVTEGILCPMVFNAAIDEARIEKDRGLKGFTLAIGDPECPEALITVDLTEDPYKFLIRMSGVTIETDRQEITWMQSDWLD